MTKKSRSLIQIKIYYQWTKYMAILAWTWIPHMPMAVLTKTLQVTIAGIKAVAMGLLQKLPLAITIPFFQGF